MPRSKFRGVHPENWFPSDLWPKNVCHKFNIYGKCPKGEQCNWNHVHLSPPWFFTSCGSDDKPAVWRGPEIDSKGMEKYYSEKYGWTKIPDKQEAMRSMSLLSQQQDLVITRPQDEFSPCRPIFDDSMC